MLALLLACLLPPDDDAAARAALALAQAPPPAVGSAHADKPVPQEPVSFKVKRKAACECGCEAGSACTCTDCPHGATCPGCNYYSAYVAAVHQQRPLLVFVGQPARDVEGCVICRERDFPDALAVCVVVSRTIGGKLYRLADIPGQASDEQIRRVLSPPVPQPASARRPAGLAVPAGGGLRMRSGC